MYSSSCTLYLVVISHSSSCTPHHALFILYPAFPPRDGSRRTAIWGSGFCPSTSWWCLQDLRSFLHSIPFMSFFELKVRTFKSKPETGNFKSNLWNCVNRFGNKGEHKALELYKSIQKIEQLKREPNRSVRSLVWLHIIFPSCLHLKVCNLIIPSPVSGTMMKCHMTPLWTSQAAARDHDIRRGGNPGEEMRVVQFFYYSWAGDSGYCGGQLLQPVGKADASQSGRESEHTKGPFFYPDKGVSFICVARFCRSEFF